MQLMIWNCGRDLEALLGGRYINGFMNPGSLVFRDDSL